MNSSRNRQLHSGGFTLLEMLVVIALVALMANLLATRIAIRPGGPAFTIAVDEMALVLREARGRAVQQGRPTTFWLDPGNGSFGIENDVPRGGLVDADEVVVKSASELVQRGEVARFMFYPDGSSSGGHILIKAGQQMAGLNIDWLTGGVEITDR